ncbi:MAG: M48 family metalloprotease [Alphaproteobacteria bacterium]|nr:M48 family metalloprotease [Alphaproteobacteria bacterium]
MTFKVQVAGLQGSEIVHLRPIKPWSHWDSAVTVAYFGAAAAMMLTLGAEVTNILSGGLADPTSSVDVAKQASGVAIWWFAMQEARQAYQDLKRFIQVTSAAIEKLPQVSHPMLDAYRNELYTQMRKNGDMRTIRFVDKDDMETILGYQERSLSPRACTNPTLSNNVICIGVNRAFLRSRDHVMQFAVVAHEVAHPYGWNKIQLIARGMQRANTQMVIFGVLQALAFQNPITLGLALTSAVVVPALLQAHYRRQEFRCDRGAALYTGDAANVAHALTQLEHNAKRFSPTQSRLGGSSTATGWQDKLNQIMWRGIEKGLGALMDTHPPVERRIRVLHTLAKHQAYQRQKLG